MTTEDFISELFYRVDEAMKEFDLAIRIGPVAGGAYNDALAGKRKLSQP